MNNSQQTMTTRSAVDTIKGYFYQFDHTIWALLSLVNETDSVSIECIEDIDIHAASETTAVQCKYYAKSEYNHSVIKEAVMFMLTHFKNAKDSGAPRIKYKLWGHYGGGLDKLTIPIDLDFLKQHFLTYKENKKDRLHHIEIGADDATLSEFLNVLTIDNRAKKFEDQFREVVDLLRCAFGCSEFSAEYFYYNSALKVVKELSIIGDEEKRRISKKSFLSQIDKSAVLFNEWFVLRKGKKRHLAELRAEYFSTFNVSPFERFFLIEIDNTDYDRPQVKELIMTLARKYSKLSKREPAPFCPYILLHKILPSELADLKSELMSEQFKLVDGYGFLGARFNVSALTEVATFGNGIKVKMLNELGHLDEAIASLSGKTKYLYQFYCTQPFFTPSDSSVHTVNIQVESVRDIKSII